MTFTYDPTTDRGRVRLLISDTSSLAERQLYSDDEIDTFLALARGSGASKVRRAAAEALWAIAGNALQTDKVIRSQDLQTDASKVAAELRQLAQRYRDEADVIEDDDSGNLVLVNFDPYAAYREA